MRCSPRVIPASRDMFYRLAEQQWQSDWFWKTVSSIVEFAKGQDPSIEEEKLRQAVLKDWLALAVPLGRG